MDKILSEFMGCLACQSERHAVDMRGPHDGPAPEARLPGKMPKPASAPPRRPADPSPPVAAASPIREVHQHHSSTKGGKVVDYVSKRIQEDEKTMRLSKQLAAALEQQEKLHELYESLVHGERERAKIQVSVIKQDDLVADLNKAYEKHLEQCKKTMAAQRAQSEFEKTEAAKTVRTQVAKFSPEGAGDAGRYRRKSTEGAAADTLSWFAGSIEQGRRRKADELASAGNPVQARCNSVQHETTHAWPPPAGGQRRRSSVESGAPTKHERRRSSVEPEPAKGERMPSIEDEKASHHRRGSNEAILKPS